MAERQKAASPAAKTERKAAQPSRGRPKGAPRKAAETAPAAQQNKSVGAAAPAAQRPAKKSGFYAPRRRAQEAPGVPLRIYPLGGVGEIGKNLTVYECEGDMVVVDCGSLFPDSDMFGVDLVIPDYAFIEQNRDKIRAIVITHGHEDHIGGLPYMLREVNVPIYATKLTIGLINNKLEEHGLRSSAETRLIVPRDKFKVGCFEFDPIHVNHSIPDAVAFAITTPAGVVVHTGDYKIDYTPVSGGVIDLATLAEYGKNGVLALLSDSTNSERPGMAASESTVNAGLQALFNKAEKQRVIIATFASNLYRIQHIIDLAIANGRKVAISGRSMVNNTQMAMELGYIKAPQEVLVDIDQINKYPPESIVIITTGSQGEALSALSRMAANSHRNVHVGPGDFIIISATPIPGNEKMVTRVVNGLLRLGAEVIYEKMYEVHASGHACQEEQKLILDLIAPKFFIPVHGEYKHLIRHAATAESMGIDKKNMLIPDVGNCIILTQDAIRLGEEIEAGAVMVDGLGVGDVGSVVLRDRRLLSQDGIVVLSATVDGATGELLSGPELFTRGFVYVRDSEELLEETRLAVQKVLEDSGNGAFHDIGSLKTHVRETASSLLYKRTKRSPMILPILMEA